MNENCNISINFEIFLVVTGDEWNASVQIKINIINVESEWNYCDEQVIRADAKVV